MSDSIKHLVSQFNLQTKLFSNVVDGVNDADAQHRLNENTNHIAWLTGHIVSTRFMLANVFGMEEKEPYSALFENGKGLDPEANYPVMKDLTKDWNNISAKLVGALANVNEEGLKQKMPRPVPTGYTLGDFLAFIIHHEAYTIGQLGICRKFFGLEAMKYA